MKILIACDSFKGSLTSQEACAIIAKSIKSVFSEAVPRLCPVADGGEGTFSALTAAHGGKTVTVTAHDALMRRITSEYGLFGDAAFIEMSAASGITLLKEKELNPLITTTFGTGELILDALAHNVRRIVLGIGGSATNDGGAGCLSALGVIFRDKSGTELLPGGKALADLASIDISGIDRRIFSTELLVACDVTSPLYGEHGATKVFAHQKGANDDDINVLEGALMHYADIVKSKLGTDFSLDSGSGAAGGLGFALKAFLNGKLRRGFDIIAGEIGLAEKIAEADLVITGEGKTDESSLLGKLPLSVAALSKAMGKQCVLISGDIALDAYKLDDYFCLYDKCRLNGESVESAINNAEINLTAAAERIGTKIKNGEFND